MVIGKYIRALLEDRSRVILPGLGNLVVKATGGIPTSGGRMDPPGLMVRFDSSFSKDDGLLASAIQAGEAIEEEEAAQRVLELVDAIKFAMDKGEPYSIPDTGTLSRDDNGKVHFQADPAWILEPDQYGLEPMELLELDEEMPVEEPGLTPSEASAPEPEPEPRRAYTIQPDFESAYRPERGMYEEARRRRSRRWRAIWITAGALIIILMGLIFLPVDQIQMKRQKVDTQPQQSVPELPARQDPAAETEAPGPGTGDSEPEAVPEETEPVVADHSYYIIAGSFRHLSYASDLQDQLLAKGYPAEVMVTDSRMYRVIVASFATKEEADGKLADVKRDPALASCWLLSK